MTESNNNGQNGSLTSPQTGNNSSSILYISLAFASAALLTIVSFTIRKMSADEKTRYETEMREKAIMDERPALTNSERRGFKKGIEEGKIRGKAKIVDNLVSNMGFDLESALKAANITEEQYNEYKHK